MIKVDLIFAYTKSSLTLIGSSFKLKLVLVADDPNECDPGSTAVDPTVYDLGLEAVDPTEFDPAYLWMNKLDLVFA